MKVGDDVKVLQYHDNNYSHKFNLPTIHGGSS